jgi:hypothetical protein
VEDVRDEFTTVYSLPEARATEWALMANSQAPFDTIWAKFSRSLSDVSIRVKSLPDRPAQPAFHSVGLPALSSG